MEKEEMWQFLIDHNIASSSEIHLAVDLCGYSKKTLEKVLFARTGYKDFEKFKKVLKNTGGDRT